MPLINPIPFTFKRQSAGSYIKGKWVPGSLVDIVSSGTKQPMSGEEMQSLPEGRRERKSFKMYLDTEVYTSRSSLNCGPDTIDFNGETFEVVQVLPYGSGLINHFKVIVQKQG